MVTMKVILLFAVLYGGALGAWIGEEYWTTVSYSGELLQGRTRNDFATLDADENYFVAFWMTRTKYTVGHFESFGYASYRADGKLCGWFTGYNREPVEICGGFRILSIPPRLHGRNSIFEWVPAATANFRSTIGFHGHRVAKRDLFASPSSILYGDAQPNRRDFVAVEGPSNVLVQDGDNYASNLFLLKLNVPEVLPVNTGYYTGSSSGYQVGSGYQPAPQRPVQSAPAWSDDRYRSATGYQPAPQQSIQPYSGQNSWPAPAQSIVARPNTYNRNPDVYGRQVVKDYVGNYFEWKQVDGKVLYYRYNPDTKVSDSQPSEPVFDPRPQMARHHHVARQPAASGYYHSGPEVGGIGAPNYRDNSPAVIGSAASQGDSASGSRTVGDVIDPSSGASRGRRDSHVKQ